MTLFEGNLPQNDTEREREKKKRKKEIKKERKKQRKKERKKDRKKERKKKKRKKERNKQKKRERESASEMDAECYGNCRKQGTTGWISLIGFARSVNVHNSICLAYAKFNGLSCMVPGYRFWGCPIALQCFVHISDKKLLQY